MTAVEEIRKAIVRIQTYEESIWERADAYIKVAVTLAKYLDKRTEREEQEERGRGPLMLRGHWKNGEFEGYLEETEKRVPAAVEFWVTPNNTCDFLREKHGISVLPHEIARAMDYLAFHATVLEDKEDAHV